MEPPIAKKVVKFVNYKQEIGDVPHASSKYQSDHAKEKNAMAVGRNQILNRTPVKYSSNRNANKLKKITDTSGDTITKPCKLSNNKKNIRNTVLDKLKTSNIPRPKSDKEEGKDTNKNIKLKIHNDNNHTANGEKEINLMINTDFCQEHKQQITFVAATTPSPTFSMTKGRINTTDSESFTDSCFDLDMIDSSNCLEIMKSDYSELSECTITSSPENPKSLQSCVPGSRKKITITINGPPNCVNSLNIENSSSVAATARKLIAEEKNAVKHTRVISSEDSYITCSTYGTDQDLPDKSMGDTSMNPVHNYINSARENLESPAFSDDYAKYMSVTSSAKSPTFSFDCSAGSQENRESCHMKQSNLAKCLSSKAEGSSEILQKTTNLENKEVLRSKGSTNKDAIQDNLSSETVDTNYEHLDKDGSSLDWHHNESHSGFIFTRHINKEMSSDILRNNEFHGCEREQKYKCFQIFYRFPGNRFRLPRILRSWPRRISFRRKYRKRLDPARLDEPSNGWSTKMLILDRKIHVMHFLQIQKSSFLDDAVIQTGDTITNSTERQLSSATKVKDLQRYTGNPLPYRETNKTENSYNWNKEQSIYEVHNTHGLQYHDSEKVSSINNNASNTRLEPMYKEAFTEPIWTYINTGTNAVSCVLQPDMYITEGGALTTDYHTHFNIIYYKPCTSTEEAHLIVNSVNPISKSVFCMVRNMKSVTTNTIMDSQHKLKYNDIDTQKTPTISTDKLSRGVITSSHLLDEETNYDSASETKDKEGIRKENMSPFFYEEIQNQLSSFINQVYLNAVGLSPASSLGKKTSDCSDVCKHVELMKILPKHKRSSSIQTQPQLPNLITTEPRIVSVSSRLLVKTCMSCAEKKANTSSSQSNLCKVKCEMRYANENLACQTTSEGGIHSMLEAESLVNDIIKQALIDNGTEMPPDLNIQPATTNTGTSMSMNIKLHSKSIATVLSKVCSKCYCKKLNSDTQFKDILENKDTESKNNVSDNSLDAVLASNEPNEIFEDASAILLKRSEKLLKDSLISVKQSVNADMIVKVLPPDRSTLGCYNCKHKEVEKTEDIEAFMYHHKVTFDATTSVTDTAELLEFLCESVSVSTTQCILPKCEKYKFANSENGGTSCVFVFGEPVCTVHEQLNNKAEHSIHARAEVETQHAADQNDVAVITPFFGLLPDRMVRESVNTPLLSPEAYKELYETTKKLVNEDINQPPERDTSALSARVTNRDVKSSDREHKRKRVPDPVEENFTKDIRAVPLQYEYTSNENARSRKHAVKGLVNAVIQAEASAQNEAMDVKSAGIVTSMNSETCFGRHCLCDNVNKSPLIDPDTKVYSSKNGHNSVIAMFRKKKTRDIVEEITCENKDKNNSEAEIEDTSDIGLEKVTLDEVKELLLSSCRYYSNMVTKQLNRVKDNITKILLLTEEEPCSMCTCKFTDACTSKPSGRGNLSCQTVRLCCPSARRHSRCSLSQSISITNICQNDREHLNSVYNILTGIDGRLRRLKMGVPT